MKLIKIRSFCFSRPWAWKEATGSDKILLVKSLINGKNTSHCKFWEEDLDNYFTKKRCEWQALSKTLDIMSRRGMQMEATMSYHYVPFRVAKIKMIDSISYWQEYGEIWYIIHYSWGYKMVRTLWKTVW